MTTPHFVERPIIKIPGLVPSCWPYIDLEKAIRESIPRPRHSLTPALQPLTPTIEGNEPLRIVTPVLASIGPQMVRLLFDNYNTPPLNRVVANH